MACGCKKKLKDRLKGKTQEEREVIITDEKTFLREQIISLGHLLKELRSKTTDEENKTIVSVKNKIKEFERKFWVVVKEEQNAYSKN